MPLMQLEVLVARLPDHRIYKVLRDSEWRMLAQDRWRAGSVDDQRDGFIHLSTAAQLAGTLERYYADERDLWLVALDPGALGVALRHEPSRGGQLFPHLHGELRLDDCTLLATRPRPDALWRWLAV